MTGLAVFISIMAVLSIAGRLGSDSKPTRATARTMPGTWQFQLWSLLAPYTVALSLFMWTVVAIRHWA